jgi:predicted nucleic acid-binding protein
VPAVERPFSGSILPPVRLYVDTDVLIAAVVSTHAHHARSVALLQLLITHGLTTIYLCPITWMEFVHVFSKESFRRTLPAEFGYLNAVTGWSIAGVRAAYYHYVRTLFDDILSPFPWEEVPLTAAVQAQATEYMAMFNLDAQDATHLACARLAGVRDLASYDRRFRRVDRLSLWNDRIYSSR